MKKLLSLFVMLCFAFSLYAMGTDETVAVSGDVDPEAWASEGITIIVPNKVGGSFDLIVRLIAKYLQAEMGVNVTVEDINGGGGLVALTEYLVEPANTTKLIAVGHAQFTVDPIYNEGESTLNMDDYIPIIGLDAQERILFVNTDKTGIKDLDGLIEYAKNNYTTFAATTEKGQLYLINQGLFDMFGIEAGFVQTDSNPESLVSVLNGDITCAIVNPAAGTQYVANGSLTPICVFSEEPYDGYEGVVVPTAKELGVDIVSDGFRYISIRKGTSPEIVQYMYEQIAKVYQNPEFIKESLAMDAECIALDSQQCIDKLNDMYDIHNSLYQMVYGGNT